MQPENEKRSEGPTAMLYRKYFRSKIVSLMLATVLFHVGVLTCEICYLRFAQHRLGRENIPGENKPLLEMMRNDNGVFRKQKMLASRSIKLKMVGICSKIFDFFVVMSFFSHRIRNKVMENIRTKKNVIRINCSHIREADINFMILVFFLIGLKNIVLAWAFSSILRPSDLMLNFLILVFRCFVIAPVMIWLFSSVYNKARWGLVLCAYVAVVVLMYLANFTDIAVDNHDSYEIIPHKVFGKRLGDEIVRLNLKNKIFWDRSANFENAALVKTGASRYIVVVGDLIKYGEKEFLGFIAHEVGHADDLSTEKKLFYSIFTIGITCAGILSTVYFLTPKYTSRGVSRFSVLAFVVLANTYIFSLITDMFQNNIGIHVEVNADIYAKTLGFGTALGVGLYKLSAGSKTMMFHSPIYTHYLEDHPSIASRVGYLIK